MAQWHSAWLDTEGLWVRASPAALCCALEQDKFYPCLITCSTKECRPRITEVKTLTQINQTTDKDFMINKISSLFFENCFCKNIGGALLFTIVDCSNVNGFESDHVMLDHTYHFLCL